MVFTFEYHHFQMDAREKIRAIKDLQRFSPALVEIVISELKQGNVITSVQRLSDSEMEAALLSPFHSDYTGPGITNEKETDPHYRGDFYRHGSQSVVAPLG